MHTANPPCPRILDYRPPRIALLLVLLATASQVALGDLLPAHESLILPGIISGLGGFLLMLRAWWLFKTRDTAICPAAETSVLVVNDVYRWTRNPMYLGIVVMMIGTALASGSLFHYAAAILFFAIIDHSFCAYEEAKLDRLFGEAFGKYARKTRRWF